MTPEDKSILEAFKKHDTDIHEHIQTLYELAVGVKQGSIVELGVRDGESTIAFLLGCKESGSHLISLDTKECPVAFERVNQHGLKQWWVFIQQDSYHYLPTHTSPVDILFIDSVHSYNHTLIELEHGHRIVKLGGCIGLHDSWHPQFEVGRAITDFLAKHPECYSRTDYTVCHGLTMLRKVKC